MGIKMTAAMKALVLDGGVQALAGQEFAVPYDPTYTGHYTNAEPVTFVVTEVDGDGFTVRLDAPMRLVMAARPEEVR